MLRLDVIDDYYGTLINLLIIFLHNYLNLEHGFNTDEIIESYDFTLVKLHQN